jgi:uncharacterized protein YdhG (YjbR/CyaY superfamily)
MDTSNSGNKSRYLSVEEYIAAQPPTAQMRLNELSEAIAQAAPLAVPVISYNMPAFRYHGILVYFAAHTKHIGFYPGATAVTQMFADELSAYETAKGTVRFPMDQPIPEDLVKQIVLFRVEENQARAETRRRVRRP